MQKPDLNRMWETYIRIGLPQDLSLQQCISVIRSKIFPMISQLKNVGTVNWYHFLIHGNPNNQRDPNVYFHIRFDTRQNITNPDDLHLPEYCERDLTKRIDPIREIQGITKSLLKNEEVEEAWRIIGEQSEWILNMLNIHKENIEIPILQITQFMHYFLNMLGLGNRARLSLGGYIDF